MDKLRKIELSNLAVLYGVDNSGTGGAVQLGASRGLGDGEDGERVHLRLEDEVRMSASLRKCAKGRGVPKQVAEGAEELHLVLS